MINNTVPDVWATELDRAFAILLGDRRTDDPSAGFAVYYAADYFDEFLFPNTWLTPDALTGAEPISLAQDGAFRDDPLSPRDWPIDLRGSLFGFDLSLLGNVDPWGPDGHLGDRPFGDAFVDDLRAVAIAEDDSVLVRGADLGPLLARHGLDLTTANGLKGGVSVYLRAATDGTLAEAMRFATHTERGPEYLIPFDGGDHFDTAEEEWEAALAAIGDRALRNHLRWICLDEDDARAAGAMYERDQWPLAVSMLEETGWPVIAGWTYGESQAGCVVVRHPLGPPTPDAR